MTPSSEAEAQAQTVLPLLISFTYSPSTNSFLATLPSGASFPVFPHQIGGKLEANLALYRDAILALGTEAQGSEVKRKPLPTAAPAGAPVRRFTEKGRLVLTLDDINLEEEFF